MSELAVVVIEVLDSVRELHALRPDRSGLLTGQELRELARVEELRTRGGVDTHYVVTVAGGRPTGLLPVYPTPATFLPPDRVTGLFAAPGPGGWTCAALLGSDTSGPNWLRADNPERVRELVGTAMSVVDGYAPDLYCLPLLDDRQHRAVAAGVPAVFEGGREEAYLDLPAGTFADWVMALPRQRRVQVRRERRAFRASTLRLGAEPVTDSAELAGLLYQVERRHGAPTSIAWEQGYLSSVAAAMGDRGTALVARLAERAVAVTLLWDVGSHWRVRCWGCDYGVAEVRDAYAYFNLMFYEPVVRATTAGVSRIIVGTGSLESKRRRGASTRPLRSIGWSTGRRDFT